MNGQEEKYLFKSKFLPKQSKLIKILVSDPFILHPHKDEKPYKDISSFAHISTTRLPSKLPG
jgi:L-lysine 2,3-aminomutase